MEQKTVVTVEKDDIIGEIDPKLFGSFIEHMGRAVYTGIYEPTHPTADRDGFRGDVLHLVRQMQVPLIRYPGGNFVSGYRWRDGIGPRENRPRRLELAWRSIETNQVGIDEFARWAKKAGCDVMPAVNLGTGQPQDAADLVEYCNFPGGTELSDKRKANGSDAPYRFGYWCVGNEMDGDWQICHLTAQEYGRKAHEAVKMMKWVDPSIRVTVAGSSGSGTPTRPEWDRIVLEHTYDEADYLSLHQYYGFDPQKDREKDYLHAYLDLDGFIRSVTATADYVKAYKRSKKTMMLSLDEWNIWHMHLPDPPGTDWDVAPVRLENLYDVKDALLLGGLMMTMINHADRIKIGCLAQLVNVIAPIMTMPGGAVFRQTTYYPYQAGCLYARGNALRTRTVSEKVETVYGDAQTLCSAAAYREETGELTLFLLNTGEKTLHTELKLREFGRLVWKEHQVFTGELSDVNSFAQQRAAMTVRKMEQPYEKGMIVELEKYSFHVFRFAGDGENAEKQFEEEEDLV